MATLSNYPLLLFPLTFMAMWAASLAGLWLRDRRELAGSSRSADFGLVLGAALTLLGLIIGFTFSMANERYQQRKVFEADEASAIGTEYARADLLPPPDAAAVRTLLAAYVDERIRFYSRDFEPRHAAIDRRTDQLQAELWSAVRGAAVAHPTPFAALAVAGMNNVLDSAGNSRAASWNRIPWEAWWLMIAIAICCNVMIGYAAQTTKFGGRLTLVLPLLVAISFLLISDIDAPRHGLIRIEPQNLEALAAGLRR